MADGFDPGGRDPRDSAQQNNTYHYNYSYGSGSGRGTGGGHRPPRNPNDWGEWAAIGLFLFILPFWFCKLIGVFWLLNKLGKMSSTDKRRYKQEAKNAASRARNTAQNLFQQGADAARQAADSARQAADTVRQSAQAAHGSESTYHYQYGQSKQSKKAQAEPWERQDKAEGWNQTDSGRKKARKKAGGGTGLVVGGSVLAAIFGLAVFVLGVIGAVENVAEMVIPIGICLPFLAGGIGMIASGISKNRRSERYLNYLAYIGANREVDLAPMAASFGTSVGKLCKDLRRMLARGILPTGYLDLAEGKLYLTEMGYHAQPRREAPPVQEETPQQAAAREDDILREIRQVNDEIPDEVMSAKIDRIEEITGKILAYQKAHPNKESQLRTFLNYYLPTTLKILRAYAQLDAQGIEGENISAAKKRIEDMMDQVVSGFEKQLDKLFQDDAMDITSDVEVLENMLKKDGLSDEGGITMTL